MGKLGELINEKDIASLMGTLHFTDRLQLLSQFDNDIDAPIEEDYTPNPDFTQSYPGTPSGTKFADLKFYATGERRKENLENLGEVIVVRLLYRENQTPNKELKDIWMVFAGYNFGVNHDGTNAIQMHRPDGTSIAVGQPDEVIKKIFRGAEFYVTIAWQKGAGDEVGLLPWPQEYYPGVGNDMNRAGYSRIEAD